MQAVASPQPRSSKLPVRSCPLSEHLSGSAPGSHQPPSEKLPPHWALSCSLPVPALTSPRKLATLAPTQPHGTSDPALSSESPQNAACGAAAGGTCGGNRYHPCWPRSDPGSSGVDGGWRPGRTQMLSFSGGFSSRRSTPRADAVVRRGCPKRQHCKLKCQDPGRGLRTKAGGPAMGMGAWPSLFALTSDGRSVFNGHIAPAGAQLSPDRGAVGADTPHTDHLLRLKGLRSGWERPAVEEKELKLGRLSAPRPEPRASRAHRPPVDWAASAPTKRPRD
ncbi:uncharacterized protein LOC118655624 isoform X4 [Myotis myotis]|uniref:uncharacterized protein LOC118655624 isoform X4 n=1 Tax=Myotis myotis TaxID=51298 RepID=UPI00174E2306|nr:uncharacterized protein LOC118655624 isoform X4 [Myotis myotis]